MVLSKMGGSNREGEGNLWGLKAKSLGKGLRG